MGRGTSSAKAPPAESLTLTSIEQRRVEQRCSIQPAILNYGVEHDRYLGGRFLFAANSSENRAGFSTFAFRLATMQLEHSGSLCVFTNELLSSCSQAPVNCYGH
jgi:hypothetical protein